MRIRGPAFLFTTGGFEQGRQKAAERRRLHTVTHSERLSVWFGHQVDVADWLAGRAPASSSQWRHVQVYRVLVGDILMSEVPRYEESHWAIASETKFCRVKRRHHEGRKESLVGDIGAADDVTLYRQILSVTVQLNERQRLCHRHNNHVILLRVKERSQVK